jgi:hypothetical protein
MLDLQARVHLDEMKGALLVQKLERADAAIAEPPARLGAARADLRDQVPIDARRRRLLDDLLVAALQRAVAVAEPQRRAVRVAQYLDLDVPRMFQEFLEIEVGIGEGTACFGAGDRKRIGQLGLASHHAHAAATAAARGLDDDRVADRRGHPADSLRIVRQGTLGAGNAGNAGGVHSPLGGDLVAHGADGSGTGTNEDEAAGFRPLGKGGVLGEKAVARMDRLGAGGFGGEKQGGRVEVAARRRGWPDAHRFIG